MPKQTFKDYLKEEPDAERALDSADAKRALFEALRNERKLSKQLLEAVLSSNKEVVQSNEELAKNLLEVLGAMSSRLDKLEESVSSAKDIKIPAPVVNVTVPERNIKKVVHRDNEGFITHVTEEEIKNQGDR